MSSKEAPVSRMPVEGPHLRPIDGDGDGKDLAPSRVVAVVLSDGSVRELGAGWGEPGPDERSWSSGSVAGAGWVLWWERRSFE